MAAGYIFDLLSWVPASHSDLSWDRISWSSYLYSLLRYFILAKSYTWIRAIILCCSFHNSRFLHYIGTIITLSLFMLIFRCHLVHLSNCFHQLLKRLPLTILWYPLSTSFLQLEGLPSKSSSLHQVNPYLFVVRKTVRPVEEGLKSFKSILNLCSLKWWSQVSN